MRRRASSRKRRGGFRFKASRRRSGGSSGGNKLMMLLAGAAAWGFARNWALQKASPVLSKVPGGQYAPALLFGGAGYLASKGKLPLINKVPYSKELGAGMALSEAFLAGASAGTQTAGGSSGTIYL